MRNVFLHININKGSLNKAIVGVTVFTILLGLVLPKALVQGWLTPIAVLFILAGIPHGASDFIIFQKIFSQYKLAKQSLFFGLGYITIVFLYLILWYFSPFLAFLLFLFNSIYHFGESNWAYVPFLEKHIQTIVYALWGTAVLAVPILLNFDQAALIIEEITGQHFYLSANFRASIIYLLCFGNFVMITTLFDNGYLTEQQFFKEMGHFVLLLLLFICTPLLIGFSVYFVFWHSIYAMRDQFHYLELFTSRVKRNSYLQQLLTISLVAFMGMGMFYWFASDFMNEGYNLGKLFVFIAVITVPHSLLMHHLYQFKVFQEKKESV